MAPVTAVRRDTLVIIANLSLQAIPGTPGSQFTPNNSTKVKLSLI